MLPSLVIPPLTAEDIRRFQSKVKHSLAGCWEWQVSRHPQGYGRFRIGKHVYYANRVAWTIRYGAIPDGLSVLHTCDNPPCCRPSHLFLGTYGDNSRDAMSKGRHYTGSLEKAHEAARTLTEQQVREIIALLDTDLLQREIAALYGIHQVTVSKINRRIRWRHLHDEE
jgi:hypothetical protein